MIVESRQEYVYIAIAFHQWQKLLKNVIANNQQWKCAQRPPPHIFKKIYDFPKASQICISSNLLAQLDGIIPLGNSLRSQSRLDAFFISILKLLKLQLH